MNFNLIILTVACISCLVPPALGTGILAAKALAMKGAALLGAGALAAKGALVAKGALAAKGALIAKGALVAKGLAAAAIKGAAFKGAALLAAKGAAVKGAASVLAAKGAALSGGAEVLRRVNFAPVRRTLVFPPAPGPLPCEVPTLVPAVPMVEPPPILEKLSGLVGVAKTAVNVKANAVSGLMDVLQGKLLPEPVPAIYRIVNPPSFYPVPLIGKFDEEFLT